MEFEEALYHLLARGNSQQAIYETDADRERFLGLLAESADRFDVAVHCFVLMGNHFHLLAQARRANLSRWMLRTRNGAALKISSGIPRLASVARCAHRKF